MSTRPAHVCTCGLDMGYGVAVNRPDCPKHGGLVTVEFKPVGPRREWNWPPRDTDTPTVSEDEP